MVRTLLVFTASVVAYYVVLMLAWPVVGPAFLPTSSAVLEFVLGFFSPEAAQITFVAGDGEFDTRLKLGNTDVGKLKNMGVNLRQLAWVPTAVVTALVLATPIPWKSRGRALLLGWLFAAAFVALRFGLFAMSEFSQAPIALFEPGAATAAVLQHATHALYYSPVASVTAPALIWVVLVADREWMASLAARLSGATPPAEEPEPGGGDTR